MTAPVQTTRALLLTDVVDSTKLVETLGAERASEVWAAHDRVSRDLLAEHDGREIDKTDGFLLLFESAPAAARYAVAYHRALVGVSERLGVELRARAGLHVGLVVLRTNEREDVLRGAKPLEVEGVAKPTAARVMSLAVGNQTLCSEAARDAIHGDLPEGSELASHGHWRMKGVAEPVHLFEVGVRGESPFTPPPDAGKVYRVVQRDGLWLPVREVPRALPAERDAFVGRERDLQQLASALGEARLVTVLGPGGMGKTRLVTRHAWTWLGDFGGGVWFCDLSEASDLEGLVRAVAAALGVRLGADPLAQLGAAIAERGECLVVLDNFEQLTALADSTVGAWLDRAPDAKMVVTSRELLLVPGEHALVLESLPDEGAVRLFEVRARDKRPEFAVTDDNRAAVTHLVQLLDGIPLAIELAAARIRVLSVAQITERMTDRFRLLAGARGAHARQATLRSAIDWSWTLLEPWEQAALAQASVFEGGFTLEGAGSVLDLSAFSDAPWPLDVVQALVDKSLLRTFEPTTGPQRHALEEPWFGMYVSIREYATEKLRDAGAEAGAHVRHGEHYAELGTRSSLQALRRSVERRHALNAELENLTVACRRAVRRGDPAVAVGTLVAAEAALRLTGPTGAAVDLAQHVLASCPLSEDQEPVVRQALGVSLAHAGRVDEVGPHLEVALALHRRRGDRAGEAVLLSGYLANLYFEQGRLDDAQAAYERALLLHRETGQRAAEGNVLRNLGVLLGQRGELERARDHIEAALAIHREVGDVRAEGTALSKIANLRYAEGYKEEAARLLEQALGVARQLGDRVQEGVFLGNIGLVRLELGELDDAQERLQTALELHRQLGYRFALGDWLSGLARLAALRGDGAKAEDLALQAVHEASGYPRLQADHWITLGLIRADAGDIAGARDASTQAHDLAKGEPPSSPVGVRLAELASRLTP